MNIKGSKLIAIDYGNGNTPTVQKVDYGIVQGKLCYFRILNEGVYKIITESDVISGEKLLESIFKYKLE